MSGLPWKPIKLPFGALDKHLDEQFERCLLGAFPSGLVEWQPQIDVRETATEYLIEADLPGVDPEHVSVESDGTQVTICGHRSESSFAATHRGVWTERRQGQFCRRLPLDSAVDVDGIEIEHVHGVYRIRIPKRADPHSPET